VFCSKNLDESILLGKGISYHIFNTLLVLGGEGKSLQKHNPFGMSSIELGLAIEELECLMIWVKRKGLRLKI